GIPVRIPDFLAMIQYSGGEQSTPTVEIQPGIGSESGGIGRIGVSLRPIRIQDTPAYRDKIIDFRRYAQASGKPFEIIVFSGFHHPLLTQKPYADIISGRIGPSVQRQIVVLSEGIAFDHGFYRVIYPVTVLIRTVEYPIPAINHRIVLVNGSTVFLLPF